jgi:hypothetical protein
MERREEKVIRNTAGIYSGCVNIAEDSKKGIENADNFAIIV